MANKDSFNLSTIDNDIFKHTTALVSLTTRTQSLGHPSQLIPTTPGKHSHCPSSCLQLAPTANSVLHLHLSHPKAKN